MSLSLVIIFVVATAIVAAFVLLVHKFLKNAK
jgi:hypothetical protein